MGKPDAFAALRLVSFRRYVVGRMMLSLGLQVQSVAVGWQLYERTGLAAALGYIGLAQVLPVFLFSLTAGQLADRVNRRSIILAAAGAQVLVAAALLGIAWADASVEWSYAALFVSGTARAFYYTANSAIVPQITGVALFPNAVTWNVNAFYVASAAGPAIGGWLIARTGGVAAAYALSLAGALGCVLTMLGVARPSDPRPEPGTADEKGWRNVVAGARYVWRTPMILAPITLDMFAVILGGATALMPIYAKDILQVGPVGPGLVARRARAGRGGHGILAGVAPATATRGADAAHHGGDLRRGHGGLRSLDELPVLAGDARAARRLGHGLGGNSPHADPSAHAGRDARTRFGRERNVHRLVE